MIAQFDVENGGFTRKLPLSILFKTKYLSHIIDVYLYYRLHIYVLSYIISICQGTHVADPTQAIRGVPNDCAAEYVMGLVAHFSIL